MLTKEKFEERFLNKKYDIATWAWDYKESSEFEISPTDFLKFAELDLNAGSDLHNLVNTLSNVKRALDCQMDHLIYEFGLSKKSKKENWNFPKKIKFLQSRKILAPRILRKINTLRNLLEHEYKKPDLSAVEDALDVATLFISYCDRFSKFPSRLGIRAGSHYFSLVFDKKNFLFNFFDTKNRHLFDIVESDRSFSQIIDSVYKHGSR